jgi:integrase
MGVYKKDDRWLIDYYQPDGKRKREAVTIPRVDPSKVTRLDALKALSIRKGQIAQGKFDVVQTKKPLVFDRLLDRYLEWARDNHRSAERDIEAAKHLRAHFGGKPLNNITTWFVEKYKSERKVVGSQPATINRELTVLRRMFNLAIQWNLTASSPVKGVKFFKVSAETPRALTDSEFQKLYEAAYPAMKPVLITAYTSGMRLGEIVKLKWEEIDLEKNCIYVRDTKNFEGRVIPMNPTLRKTLLALKNSFTNEPVFSYKSKDSLGSSFRKVLKFSRIPHCRFHDLRHTFATRLVMNGVDLITVQELLGHKDIRMVKRYSHPTPEHKRRAVESLKLQVIDTYMDTSKSESSQIVNISGKLEN